MKSRKGFTLVELLVYVAVFATVSGLLTGILYNSVRVTNRESASTEVAQQLNQVMGTIQKLVGDASLIESVYRTDGSDVTQDIDPDDDPAFTEITNSEECDGLETFCTMKLRFSDDNVDPTWIIASSGGIYLVRGDDDIETDPDDETTTLLTTEAVLVDFLRFTKYEFAGGHSSAKVDISLTYNTDNDKFRVTRTLTSAIGRVTAATFDDSLIPNGASYDVGLSGSKWRDGYFSRDIILGGSLAIAEGTSPGGTSGYGKLYVNSTNKGLYFINSSSTASAVSLNTDTKCLWLADPVDTDDLKSVWLTNGFSATITKMWCESDQTVNLDLQVDDGTPADVNGTDLACDATPPEDEAMGGDPTMADGDRLDLAITSVSGSPTWLSLCWTVTYDF